MSDQNLSSFVWSVADLLRRDYMQSDYGKVILPFTVLRCLDCVLEPTKAILGIQVLSPTPFGTTAVMEVDLAEDPRREGYTATGGH